MIMIMIMRVQYFTARTMVVVMIVGVNCQHIGCALTKETEKFRVPAYFCWTAITTDMAVEAINPIGCLHHDV